MGRFARIVGAVSIIAAPVLLGAADELRMFSEQATGEVGIVTESGEAEALAQFAAIARNMSMYEGAAWLAFAGVLLSIPAAAAMWALAKDRSRIWAWTGLVLGVLGIVGQVVHLVGYYAHQLLFASAIDPAIGLRVANALEEQAYFAVLFIPFFFAYLAYVPQTVALRRARTIPLWTMIVALAATVLFLGLGSTPISTAVWALGLAVGLAPAALRLAGAGRADAMDAVESQRLEPATV